MSLITGTRLGPYEILAPIGSGGMGQVYKARDTRLGRVVAIKILKDQFSERFEREARAVAALNHPNISQLYDIGPNYLVIEFVEGVPIRPADSPQKFLNLASQIADGLTAAHAAGIVHRDLKPGNILVNRSGQVKILDFGLAMIGPDSMEATDARATGFNTGKGATVGTVAYMSPEQARGEIVDARSDLFSFGVVLYEMATRVRPFDGATSAIVFESLLGKSPVPVRERNPKISSEVERIIGRLLEKDRETRYQSAADVRADLKRVERDSSSGGIAAVLAPTPAPRRMLKYVIAVSALVLLAVVVGLFNFKRTSTPVTLPSEYTQLTNFNDSAISPSFSRNGQMLTFIRGGEFCCNNDRGQGQVYVKLLPNGESVQLTYDAGAKFGPVFTPDGSRITYTAFAAPGWNTWTVPVISGTPTLYLPNAFGLTWITDQHVLFSEIMTGTILHMGLVTAKESRAEPRDIYFPEHERAMAHFSHLSPDRKSVLIVEMDSTIAWQPCRLVPFDGSSAGRQVGPHGQCKSTGWSPDGKWMYFSVTVANNSHLWRQRFPDGAPEQITFGPNEEEGVAIDPDGHSLVTSVGGRQAAIWIHDAGGERPISSEGYAFAPRLSRDSRRLFYLLRKDSSASVNELRSLDLASGKSESVLPGVSVRDYDISLDENEVAYTSTSSDGESQIWLASLDRRSAPRPIAHSGYAVSFGAKDELVFLELDKKVNYLYRIKKDGTGLERITETPIQNKGRLSRDGEWVLATVAEGEIAIPVHGGTSRKFPGGLWSLDGRFFYLQPLASNATASGGRTYVIPLPAGKPLPDLPAAESDWAKLPGVQIIPHGAVSPGPDPSMYVFTRTELMRNLFRIPLH